MQVEAVNAVGADPIPGKKPPKVSVCVVTYNQEKYIAQCLQSIVDQETDFDFEIIVGDDCSTDGTREIVRGFAEKYPEKFRILFHPQNGGAALNYIKTHELAVGEYVAHIDGDDFAFPGKLQKQVDVLDEKLECVICSHDMVHYKDGKKKWRKSFNENGVQVKTLSDLYRNLPFFSHSSKMFRNNNNKDFFSFINKDTIDFEIHIKQAENGNIAHICEYLGGYNADAGISFSGGVVNKAMPAATRRAFLSAIAKNPSDLSIIELKSNFAKKMLSYAYQSARFGNSVDSREYAKESLAIANVSILQFLILWVSYIPGAGKLLSNIYYRFSS